VAASGFRRLRGPGWIQFLQTLSAADSFTAETVKAAASRVVRLDPNFVQPYVYGAGTMAFSSGMERPYDAIALLQEGSATIPGSGPCRRRWPPSSTSSRTSPSP